MPKILVPFIVVIGAAGAAVANPPPIFTDLSYEEARARAAEQQRLFLVDATAVWCAPCKMMDRTTWVDQDVTAWLDEHAIAAQIDVDEEGLLAHDLGISALPTIIAIRGDEEVDRAVGYKDPEQFLDWLADVREGKSTIDRLREDVEQADEGPALVEAREQLAKHLVVLGKHEEAAREFVWLWRNIPEMDPAKSGVRASFMASDMERVAQADEGAKRIFAEVRDETERRLKADERNWDDLGDWLVLNRVVADAPRSLAWVDRVKDSEEGLRTLRRLSYLVDDLLLENERWADFGLILLDPVGRVKRDHARIKQTLEMMGDRLDEEVLAQFHDLQRSTFRETAGMIHAGLLAAQRDQQAWDVVEAALELDDSADMRHEIARAALRADVARERHVDLLQGLPLEEEIRKAIDAESDR